MSRQSKIKSGPVFGQSGRESVTRSHATKNFKKLYLLILKEHVKINVLTKFELMLFFC